MRDAGKCTWIDSLAAIEELEDAVLDPALVDEFERRAKATDLAPIRFSTPTFKSYASSEIQGMRERTAFPPFRLPRVPAR